MFKEPVLIAANQFDMARANPMMEQIMGRLGFGGGAGQSPMNTGADLASQIPGAPQASLYNMPPIDPSLVTEDEFGIQEQGIDFLVRMS